MASEMFPVITAEQLRRHWQAHRALTRRMIEAYPDDELYAFSVGTMRPFGSLVLELLSMAAPMIRGAVTGEWDAGMSREPLPKAELLRRWDSSTVEIDSYWARLPSERFQEEISAFGEYQGRTIDHILYIIDNEIHHRGQGYVYMRALGLDPPHFWDRS